MKQQIQNIIEHQRMARYEVQELLNELSLYDYDKIDLKLAEELEIRKNLFQQEYDLRSNFINDLEDVLGEN